MVAGRDGALLISESSSGFVSRMTLDGRFTDKYRIRGGFNDGVALGRDTALWVLQGSLGQLTRLDLDR